MAAELNRKYLPLSFKFFHRDDKLYLIDLDAVKKRLTVPERFSRKDVNHFIKNWRDDGEIMALESICSLG